MKHDDDFVLLLRSKTPLGRLVETEVHAVLDYFKSIGFVQPTDAEDEPAVQDVPPASDVTPPPVTPDSVPPPPPVA